MARSWAPGAAAAATLLLLLPFATAASEQAKASPPGMLELTDTTFSTALSGEEGPLVSVPAPSPLPPAPPLLERSPSTHPEQHMITQYLLQSFQMTDGCFWSFMPTGECPAASAVVAYRTPCSGTPLHVSPSSQPWIPPCQVPALPALPARVRKGGRLLPRARGAGAGGAGGAPRLRRVCESARSCPALPAA